MAASPETITHAMARKARKAAATGASLVCTLTVAASLAWAEDAPSSATKQPPAAAPSAAPKATPPAAVAPSAAPKAAPPAAAPSAAPKAAAPKATPEVTVLNTHEVEGVLGREVRDPAKEDMGRIVDVLVGHGGEVRAAIIDFGGFLGVGSRKIAVDWNVLHFPPPGKAPAYITLELTRDQVKAAPEYQEGKPVVVLGALGKLERLPFE
jgi:pyruvate/2-oxoglutarate dehydrogenase complex dihydrolipoamide acyltransferase (E2) component